MVVEFDQLHPGTSRDSIFHSTVLQLSEWRLQRNEQREFVFMVRTGLVNDFVDERACCETHFSSQRRCCNVHCSDPRAMSLIHLNCHLLPCHYHCHWSMVISVAVIVLVMSWMLAMVNSRRSRSWHSVNWKTHSVAVVAQNKQQEKFSVAISLISTQAKRRGWQQRVDNNAVTVTWKWRRSTKSGHIRGCTERERERGQTTRTQLGKKPRKPSVKCQHEAALKLHIAFLIFPLWPAQRQQMVNVLRRIFHCMNFGRLTGAHTVCAVWRLKLTEWCFDVDRKKKIVLWTAAKKLDWKLSYGDAFSWVSVWAAMLCTIGNWEIHNFRPHPTHPLCEIWFAANLCCLSFPPLSYISFCLEGFSRFSASLHQWEDEKNINESTSTLVCGEKILKFNFPLAHLLRWL